MFFQGGNGSGFGFGVRVRREVRPEVVFQILAEFQHHDAFDGEIGAFQVGLVNVFDDLR